MKNSDLNILKSKIDNGSVVIKFTDGEQILAKVISVSEIEQDVICDVVSTNNSKKSYKENSATLVRFNEIDSVLLPSNS